MKKVLTAALVVSAILLNAQKGQVFPTMLGASLDDKPVTIPAKNKKSTIVGIVFKRAAEKALKKWLNPMYNTFMVKNEGKSNFDVAQIYDVNFHFIPLISGLKAAKAEFKAETDKGFWPYIIDSDSDIKTVKKALGITDDEIPYFYVLDKDGKILEVASGTFTEAKMTQLEDAVE